MKKLIIICILSILMIVFTNLLIAKQIVTTNESDAVKIARIKAEATSQQTSTLIVIVIVVIYYSSLQFPFIFSNKSLIFRLRSFLVLLFRMV